MIYLASPYTAPQKVVMTERYMLTVKAMAQLLTAGHMVYSPIVHCHVISTSFGLPTDYEFWLSYNNHFISLCAKMYVLCIPGWKESKGVKAEVYEAKSRGIPIEGYTFTNKDSVLTTVNFELEWRLLNDNTTKI